MKKNLVSASIVVILAIVAISPMPVLAGAYETQFESAIAYMNVGAGATNSIQLSFYDSPSDTTPQIIVRPNLNQFAGTIVLVGSLLSGSLQGTAIMSSDQPLSAMLLMYPQGSATVKIKPASGSFSSGTQNTLIATVLKNMYTSNTILSVQNVGSSATSVSIKFYRASDAGLQHTINQSIQPGAGYFVDAGIVPELGSVFNGSAFISTTGGSVVSSAAELGIGSNIGGKTFEGVGTGAKTIYMPSAICNAFAGPQNTSYAIQNTSLTTSTDVTVLYSNNMQQTLTVGPGAKQSFIACSAQGMPNGFNGSAKITSSITDVIAMGKAYGAGLTTAFVGATVGYSKLVLPYVRYANNTNYADPSKDQGRTFLTIQNIGSTTIAANTITVKYYGKDGSLLSTHTYGSSLASNAKFNSNASLGTPTLTEFGYYGDGSEGGGAIIEGPIGAQLAVVTRVSFQTAPSVFASEDYSASPIQ